MTADRDRRHTDRNEAEQGAAGVGAQRIDKWLWYVRLIKSRTMASGLVEAGKVRINKQRVTKASATVSAGDIVTLAVRGQVRVLEVVAPGNRRGPAEEAKTLYRDMTPRAAPADASATEGETPVSEQQTPSAGRLTKKLRRQFDRVRGREE